MRPTAVIIATIALLAMSVVTAAIMLKSMDVGSYRPLIAAGVKSATGRDLMLDGEIQFTSSLYPTIAVDDVALANAPWGARPQMAVIERLEAELSLLHLLFGEVRINRIALIGGDILLETDASGLGNWTMTAGADGDTDGSQPGDDELSSIAGLTEVLIRDATLTIRNARSNTLHTVAIRHLSARAEGRSQPVAVTFEGAINGAKATATGQLGALHLLGEGMSYPVALTGRIAGARFAVENRAADADPDDTPGFRFSIAGDDLAALGPALGVSLPPLGPYSVSATVRRGDSATRFEAVEARVGGSKFTGNLAIVEGGKRPKLKATLTSPSINLADFGFGPLLAIKPDASPPPDARLFPGDPLPLSSLRDIDAVIDIASKRVEWRPVSFGDARVRAVLDGGHLTVRSFKAGWQGGTVQAALRIDARSPALAVEGTIKGQRVTMGTLLLTLGMTEGLSGGPSDFDITLYGRGDSIRAILGSVDGSARIEVGPGRIGDRFARHELAEAVGLIDMDVAEDAPNLYCMAGRFDVEGGVARSRGLVIETNGAVLIGKGSVDLENETLDIKISPHAKQVSLMSFRTPLIVGGTLVRPTVATDPTNLAVGAAAVVATGATGGIAAIVAALIAGGVAAAGTAADDAPGRGVDRCAAVLAKIETDATSDSASPTPLQRSGREFR